MGRRCLVPSIDGLQSYQLIKCVDSFFFLLLLLMMTGRETFWLFPPLPSFPHFNTAHEPTDDDDGLLLFLIAQLRFN